jgi:hypothetical protein
MRRRSLPRTVIFLTSISRTPPADPSSAFSSWMSARRCGFDEASDRHLANASVAARLHHAIMRKFEKGDRVKQGARDVSIRWTMCISKQPAVNMAGACRWRLYTSAAAYGQLQMAAPWQRF